jgi:protease-4
MQTLMDSHFDQIVRGIAEGRHLEPETVRELINRGPFRAQEALEAGLVDRLAYRDEVRQSLEEQAGDRARFLFLSAYLSRAGRPNTSGTTVALIQGFGAVTRGRSAFSPIDGSVTMGSASVSSALRDAIDDDRVKAIIFRVDSPGGSYVASDTIWRETVRAREAGKPLIVSMGNLAGSGGYFVAMDADRIVAQPGTITASIGVFGGKLVTSGLWNKLGITHDDVRTSEHSTIFSASYEYSEGEYERLQSALDRIYEDFTSKVAAGRELPLEEVLELARGRIYTGERALELGLVDELGGLNIAVQLARELLELDDDADVRLKRFPRRRSTLDLLFGKEPENSERAVVRALAETFRALQPTARLLHRLAWGDDPGILAMPEWSRIGELGD